ncbi:MAG: single-stranded-DNA-specific exonuclease RecJ [Burkholderiaceae bacterium]
MPETPLRVTARAAPADAVRQLAATGLHPVVARLFVARGVARPDELALQPAALLPPEGLAGIDGAARLLADTIDRGEAIVVVADYDCDGATACAAMVRGLRAMGAVVDYIVPNRFEHGYGLSPEIVELAARHPRLDRPPALIVTVDNGIASLAGVERAAALGIAVLVTDHHLPGERLPSAAAIVNPNQPGCGFASKHLAGVGVAFYVLLALRAELRARGRFSARPEPALQELLDLVALGTVADLVRLDRNNRILVHAGMRRIRAARAVPGLLALLQVAGREARRCVTADLGFAVGPRINAAGRLQDITVGIECLLADDPDLAMALAARLDAINRERRQRELQMREQALLDTQQIGPEAAGVVVRRDDWHEGIIGLVASRLKDRLHRPVFALAPAAGEPGFWRGSGRSIAGLHLRDALDLVSKRHPDLLTRFGGHAMAAGLSLHVDGIDTFRAAFDAVVRELADPTAFERETVTDGPLDSEHIDAALVSAIDACVWGQGFPEPLFCNEFDVIEQRLLKERHSRLTLRLAGRRLNAIFFDHVAPLGRSARLFYRLVRDDYRGFDAVQLMIVGVAPESL